MKRNISVIINILILLSTLFLIGFVFYLGILKFENDGRGYTKGIIIFFCLAGLLLSTFLVPLVHEMGHLIFGLLSKMAFYSMRILFFIVYREGKKIKLRVAKNSAEYSGSCEMVPKSSEKLYSKFMFMVIGGSFFTLIYLVFLIYIVVNASASGLNLYSFLGCGLPFAFYLFTINILPLSSVGEKTDGGVILGLLKKDRFAMATINLLAIQSHYFLGETPAEVEEGLYFNVPQLPDNDVTFAILLNYRYIYYLDKGDQENLLKISERMNEVCDGLDDKMRMNIRSDILYNYCRFIKDDEKAEKLYKEVRKYLMLENTCTNLRIRAAYSFYIEKNNLEARQFVNRGLDEAKRSIIKGIGIFETRLLNELKTEILAKIEKEESKSKQDNLNVTRIFK